MEPQLGFADAECEMDTARGLETNRQKRNMGTTLPDLLGSLQWLVAELLAADGCLGHQAASWKGEDDDALPIFSAQ
jgi:hypothetical protein